jgi:hypothetical protein
MSEENKELIDKTKEVEEDDGYSCKKCWYGYCACIVWVCKVIFTYLVHL